MKKITVILLFLVSAITCYSQNSDQIEMYPEKYSKETVDSLIFLKDYGKTVWYLINIYGEDQKYAKKKIKEIESYVPDLESFIQQTFVINAMADPKISDFSNGELKMDGSKLKLKGSWADALIECIKK